MRKGAQTLVFESKPVILSRAAIGGKKEGEGPLAAGFDELRADNSFGQSGLEAAEAERTAAQRAAAGEYSFDIGEAMRIMEQNTDE